MSAIFNNIFHKSIYFHNEPFMK